MVESAVESAAGFPNEALSLRSTRALRLVALGGGINGNSDAYSRTLHDLGDHLLIVLSATSENTAFEPLQALERSEIVAWDEHQDPQLLIDRVAAFRPDAIMSAGWNIPSSYRKVMKQQPSHVLRMMFMDSIWQSSPKQWVGRGLHPLLIKPLFDVAFVPSERTEFMARRIGFGPRDIIRGAYTADTPLFDSGPRSGEELASRRRFLFVGRLIPFKGVDVLAQAYRRYRAEVPDPWDLHIVGLGPEEHHLKDVEGVTMRGFLQSSEVATLMHESSCLVLTSNGEHYGLVVHEAAAAGLPLLVSETAGAVPGLIQDGYNGWSVPEGDVAAWSASMTRMAGQPAERLGEMSAISHALSTRLSPSGWARNLHEEIYRRTS
ncbi:MAG TPA: glycosyltransferase family 4 protein [Acidimicrobiales bacterium]|jgi:glycosyltransferase involved in cell wall biosynthesis